MKSPVKYALVLGLVVGCHFSGIAQIDELANEIKKVETGAQTIGNSVISIVRIIAAILITIAGLTFLIMKSSNSDTTQKAGNVVVGLVIFYALIEVANGISA